MPLNVISGTFRLIGASPDGDSIRFVPDDPDAWRKAGIAAKPNAQGAVQLRLDAIDALETHYTPPHAAHQWRQPARWGDGAAAQLLTLLGFKEVTRNDRGVVTSAAPETRPGYILTRFADVYGRAVSLVYAGRRRGRVAADGTAHVDVAELKRSVNYRLLADGWVYPTFYSKLYYDFRDALAEAALTARNQQAGIWADDSTLTGFSLTRVGQLTDDLVILPKLFRRLAEYLSDSNGAVSLAGFKPFLAAHRDDTLYTVPTGQHTTLDTLIDVTRRTVKLTVAPEQIVFIES